MKLEYIFLILIAGLLVLSINLTSALEIRFFYSPSCSHCQNIIPLVQQLSRDFKWHDWFAYDVTKGSYNISGIPTIRIKDRCYNVEIVGDIPIQNKLKCEVQQMTTSECITKSADIKLKSGESWFIN